MEHLAVAMDRSESYGRAMDAIADTIERAAGRVGAQRQPKMVGFHAVSLRGATRAGAAR